MRRESLMTYVQVKDWERQEGRVKRSFWASDHLRPALDIYWTWIGVDKTNPIVPESLLLMQVGKLYEEQLVKTLEAMGDIVPLDDHERIKELGLVVKGGQFRLEMEREYVPVTGYMDAVAREGYPVEIKTHYASHVDAMLEAGKPPSDHYCHQAATYIDYMGADRGLIISANRANGKVYYSMIYRTGETTYTCKGYDFDIGTEYKRWRRLMEDNIIPMKEPNLEYFYRPTVTKQLLDKYAADKIKKAIKGERVLSDHNWRYQYSDYKQLVMEKEANLKGISVDELCMYTDAEVEYMMEYLNVEWKETKRGMQLHKIKERKR